MSQGDSCAAASGQRQPQKAGAWWPGPCGMERVQGGQGGARSLFHSTMSMIAVAEGGIIAPSEPEFDSAVNDALYGILINSTHRLVYDKDTGLDLVPVTPM